MVHLGAVEQCHRVAATVILFIIPAVGGMILSVIFLLEYLSISVLGGIFGSIGACIVGICMNWLLLFGKHVNALDKGMRFWHMEVRFFLLFVLMSCGPYTDSQAILTFKCH
jgi:hypothetical protein